MPGRLQEGIANLVDWNIAGGLVELEGNLLGFVRLGKNTIATLVCNSPGPNCFYPVLLTGTGFPRATYSWKTKIFMEETLDLQFPEIHQTLFHCLVQITAQKKAGSEADVKEVLQEMLPFMTRFADSKEEDAELTEMDTFLLPPWVILAAEQHQLGLVTYDVKEVLRRILPPSLEIQEGTGGYDRVSWELLCAQGASFYVIKAAEESNYRIRRKRRKRN